MVPLLLRIGAVPEVTQGGFKTPLPNWNAGGSTTEQGGFKTPLPNWNAGGNAAEQGGFRTPLPFWNAGSDGAVDEGFLGGGAIAGRPKHYAKVICYESTTRSLDYEIEPLPAYEERSDSYQAEVDRFGQFIDQMAFRIEAAEKEIQVLELREELESQLRLELLRQDIERAREFIAELIEEIYKLILIKRRRQDEEVIIALIVSEG